MCWAGVMKNEAVARDLELTTRRDVAKDADISIHFFIFFYFQIKTNQFSYSLEWE